MKWKKEALQEALLQQKGATEGYPFGPDVAVFKVMGKMFALIGLTNDPLTVNLKCDPDEAISLRSIYPAIKPGYHMNKRHWNTVTLDGSLDEALVLELIEHSYALVVGSLRRVDRAQLDAL